MIFDLATYLFRSHVTVKNNLPISILLLQKKKIAAISVYLHENRIPTNYNLQGLHSRKPLGEENNKELNINVEIVYTSNQNL